MMVLQKRWIAPIIDLVIGPRCGVPCAQLELIAARSSDKDLDRQVEEGHAPYKVVRVENPRDHSARCIAEV